MTYFPHVKQGLIGEALTPWRGGRGDGSTYLQRCLEFFPDYLPNHLKKAFFFQGNENRCTCFRRHFNLFNYFQDWAGRCPIAKKQRPSLSVVRLSPPPGLSLAGCTPAEPASFSAWQNGYLELDGPFSKTLANCRSSSSSVSASHRMAPPKRF